jgi:hypothetical protein
MEQLSQRKPGFGKPRKTGYKSSVRNLDVIRFALNFPTFLPDGVMAAQVTLTHLVMVRIHVGQPFDAPSKHGLLMACGRRDTGNQIYSTNAQARRGACIGMETLKIVV